MAHSEDTTAILTKNEPSNGTHLILRKGGDWSVIVRDDDAARSWDAMTGDHWFAGEGNDEPMSLHQHLKYVDTVYSLGDPLVVFA